MNSYEEAKRQALNDGIPEQDLTPEVIKLYRWDPKNALDGLMIDQSSTAAQVAANIALLKEEAKANAIAPHIWTAISKVIAVIPGIGV